MSNLFWGNRASVALAYTSPATSNHISVDAKGFTFISPSVYLVFDQLAAGDYCGVVGSLPMQTLVTKSCAQYELSTIVGAYNMSQSESHLTQLFNSADLHDCSTSLVTETRTETNKESGGIRIITVILPDWNNLNSSTLHGDLYTSASLSVESRFERCNPVIALQPWMAKLDPAWSACNAVSIEASIPGVGPLMWDPPFALGSVDSLLDPIITVPSSMTTTPAAPSAAPPSIAAITGTAGAPAAPLSSQAGADPPAASGPEPPSSRAPPFSQAGADPPAASSAEWSLSHAPLGLPPHLDGSTSNLAQSPETTDAPPSGSSSRAPQLPDPRKQLNNADSTDPLPVTAFSVASAIVTPVAGSPGVFVMEDVTLTQGAAPSVIGGFQVSWAPGSMFINGKGASIPANPSAQPPQPAAGSARVFVASAVEGQPLGGAIVISGSTIVPGAAAVTIDNVPYSIDPAASRIVIGGQTQRLSAISPQPTSQPANIIIAGQTLSPIAPGASVLIIGDKTLSINGPAATISNTPVSLAPGGNIIVGTSTITPQIKPTSPSVPTLSYFTIGSETFTANRGKIVAAGKTLTPGGPAITISGTPVSLASGDKIIFGTSTITPQIKPTDPPIPTVSYFTIDGETFTVNHGNIVAAGTTLTPGGSGITVSGTPVSLAPGGNIIVGTSTLTPQSDPTDPPFPVSYFTIGSEKFTVEASNVIVAGATLTPGGSGITISGTPISLGLSALIIGTETEKFTIPPTRTKTDNKLNMPTTTTSSGASYFTIASETFAVGASDVVVDGTTLTPGSPGITVSGVRVSLGASVFVVGTRTEVLAASAPGTTAGIGALIMSGLGGVGGGVVSTGAGTTGAGDSPAVFVGAAVRDFVVSKVWLLCGIVVFVIF